MYKNRKIIVYFLIIVKKKQGVIEKNYKIILFFQVLFSHKEPPLELLDTDAKVGENISYVTFGKLPVLLVYVCKN